MTARRWVRVCSLRELEPGRGVAALVGGRQVALFRLAGEGATASSRLRAVDNVDPATGAAVLSRGLLGSTGDVDYVASPMRKHRYDLASGRCLDGDHAPLRVWPVRAWGGAVEVLATTDEGPDPPAAPPTPTTCPFCALQCTLGLHAPGGVPEVAADASSPVNRGRLCVKGWASARLIDLPDRLTTPLLRSSSGSLLPATWDAALDDLAGRLLALRAASGPESVGVFGSGVLTNEAAYLLGKFARLALATPHIDYNGRFCMASAAAAANRSLGLDRGMPFPVTDLARTATLLLWGANPADTMPPLMQHVDAMRAAGGTLVVVDPRRTATAAVADLHLQPVPGSDLVLALGMLHVAVARGLTSADHLPGWAEVAASVAEWTPSRVAATTGVPAAVVDEAVTALAAQRSVLLTGRGPEQQVDGTDTVTACINLMLALGKVGGPASGWGCLTGQANGQGGREHGQKADQLPGYRSITDPADRAAVAAAWGVDPSVIPGAGRSAVELLASIGAPGGIRGLLVAGSELAVAPPDVRSVEQRLGSLELLAVLDTLPTRTAALADVVLPVAAWAEVDGTTTNLEGRVQLRRAVRPRPAGTRSDLEVLVELAGRLGVGDLFPSAAPAVVFDELARASAGGRADYSGLSHAALAQLGGVQWPCTPSAPRGTPRVCFERPRFVAVAPHDDRPVTDAEHPLWLVTGRHREAYNSGTQTSRLPRLARSRPAPLLVVHPALGFDEGAEVRIESRHGWCSMAVTLSREVAAGVVWAPIHWGGDAAVNALIGPAVDPVSKMPGFKGVPVRVVPLAAAGG